MPIVIALIAAGGVIAWSAIKGPQRVELFAGSPRRIRFADGSSEAHASRLRATFLNGFMSVGRRTISLVV